MINSPQNQPELFPELDLNHLRDYAEEWVKKNGKNHKNNKYTILIERVILHRIPTRIQERFKYKFKGKYPTTKYCIVFEVSNCNELSNQKIWKAFSSLPFWRKVKLNEHIVEKIILKRLWDLRDAIKSGRKPYIMVVNDECRKFAQEVDCSNGRQKPHPFIDSVFFRRVYNERVAGCKDLDGYDHQSEWHFDVAHVDDNYIDARLKDIPYIILYPITHKTNEKVIAIHKKKVMNGFIREGEYWRIIYKGRETIVKNRERITYIVHLLAKPKTEFHARELYMLVKGIKPETNEYYSNMHNKSLEEEHLNFADITSIDLPIKDKENLENRIYKLWNEFKKHPNSISMQKEWLKCKTLIYNEYGVIIKESKKGLKFNHKTRLSNHSEVNRIRLNVKNNISNAIEDIGSEKQGNMPNLENYLNKNIKTGMMCSFTPNPDTPIDWYIKW